jgi:hypothetical protein
MEVLLSVRPLLLSTSRPLRILITNIYLKSRTGTEAVVRDLALGLRTAGHLPMVYSPELGDIAQEIAAAGIPVADDLRRVPEPPDVVHGHHHVETVQALQHFPQACGIFVCHDRLAWHDTPPFFPRIFRYVAVDLNCRERLAGVRWIPESRIRVIYNWVSTTRFPQRPPLPMSPQRALIFSNYAGIGTHREPIQGACDALNIAVEVIGSNAGTSAARPEQVLGTYDLVFAKARCALEAMATGAAVVLCDTRGLGPMVTANQVETLRPWNFGMRCLSMALDRELIVNEIRRYDPADALAVSMYIRKYADFGAALDRYLRLYEEVLAEHRAQPRPNADEGKEYLGATMQHLGELEREVEDLRRTRVMAELHLGELERELEEHRRTRVMAELPRWVCAHLHLRILRAPTSVQRGAALDIQVEVENGTAWTLGTFPPFPLNLSYRWMLKLPRRHLVREGERTPLLPALVPGQKGSYILRAVAPEQPGTYRVRATLVQEGLRWLDCQFPRVFADAIVTVT